MDDRPDWKALGWMLLGVAKGAALTELEKLGDKTFDALEQLIAIERARRTAAAAKKEP